MRCKARLYACNSSASVRGIQQKVSGYLFFHFHICSYRDLMLKMAGKTGEASEQQQLRSTTRKPVEKMRVIRNFAILIVIQHEHYPLPRQLRAQMSGEFSNTSHLV